MRQKFNFFRSAGIVMAAFVLSKIVGFARDVIIGHAFGTRPELDAYYAAFRAPDLLFTIIAGGALGAAFIPVLSSHLTKGDREGAWRLASAVVNLSFLLVAILALGIALFAPFLVEHLIAPGFSQSQKALTTNLMRIILISTLIFAVSGVVMDVLKASRRFLLPSLAPILYNLGIAGGAMFLSHKMSVYGLAVGVVIGSAMHLAVQIPGLIRIGVRWWPSIGRSHSGLKSVVRLMGPRVLSLGMARLNLLIVANLASRLAPGSISALNYAWQLTLMPESIFAMAIGIVIFPTFSELYALEKRDELRRTFASSLKVIFALTAPATVCLIFLGRPIIQLLFQRGAFGEGSTDLVYKALKFYALGLIGYSMMEVVARFFYAQQDTLTPLYFTAGSVAVNLLLGLALMGEMGHGGLALASSIAISLEVFGLLLIARRRLKGETQYGR